VGLLDRLRNVAPARTGKGSINPDDSEREAMRQLDEGMANEDADRLQEALANYDTAIRLKPNLGRAHFNRGNVLLELNDPQGALEAYASALVHKPDSAAAFYNKGNAHARLGQREASVTAYQKALALKPDFADAEIALGVALQDLKRVDEAIASFRRAIAIKPDYAEVYYNLGGALVELGKLDEAVSSFRQGLEIKPDYAEAHAKLGIALADLGQSDAAAASYIEALKFRPDLVEAHNNLAAVLIKLGQPEAAIASYRQALELAPDQAEVHSNLGVALKKLGKFEDAVASYRRALAIKPDLAEAHSNLGTVLHKLGQIDESLRSYRKALEIAPDNADVHNNLGFLQNELGQLEAATDSYRRALGGNPEHIESLSNLGSVLADLGKLEEAAASYRRALEIKPDYTLAHSNLIFTQNYMENHSSSELLAEARRFGETVAQQAHPYTIWNNSPESARCLRIGIVSADLRVHPVGYFAENVLGALISQAGGRLELFGYYNFPEADAITERIKSLCRAWHDIHELSDERLAQLIRDDNIDILIDLSGHTGKNRLPMFAWKPAPVQVTWLGYFATTGVSAIDYLIADPWTLPESEEVNFSETIWRLPETRLCFTPPAEVVDVAPLPVLANDFITFGCFNNLTKINDQVVALWARILVAIPNSRLFLKSRPLGEASVQQQVRSRFAEHGIDPQRLILEPYVPRGNYLAAYNQVDIALDPFPFPGGTTTVEALWMGVPVLTLAGKHFLARQGVGLLMNAGLPEWVASDSDHYVALAVQHASDPHRLAALRAELRQQVLASPIFDAARFAWHFEAALRGMWEQWCRPQ
jgi:protein O-GlcNAc transferase